MQHNMKWKSRNGTDKLQYHLIVYLPAFGATDNTKITDMLKFLLTKYKPIS